MERKDVDVVFIVLTYRNVNDLNDLLKSIITKVNEPYKLIVVNSYYDDFSCNVIRDIAIKNDCDFLNVENKGYGYGNNRGIQYARENYTFQYLVISNPDIEIINFSIKKFNGLEDCIIAPSIKTLSGKRQNPYYYSKINFIEWLVYISCKKEHEIFAYIGVVINKLYREIALFIDSLLKVKKRKIYASHGSFVIFGNKALEKIGVVYDERMFLFSEENHLARLCSEKSIKTYMVPEIKVLHKEDGSVGLDNINTNKFMRESFITYYENWNKGI